MISKLVTQRSGEALVRLSFFQPVVFWCQKEREASPVILGRSTCYCAFAGEILSSPKVAVEAKPECFQETLEPRLQVLKHIVLQQSSIAGSWLFLLSCLKLANVILRWLDKNATKSQKKQTKKTNHKVSLYQASCAVGLNLNSGWRALGGLGGRASRLPRWQTAVHFSSLIHFFCSTLFDVLFSIYLQLYWQM